MGRKRFKSKIDRWILVLIIAIAVIDLLAMTAIAIQGGDAAGATGVILVCIGVLVLLLSLTFNTHYTVDGDTLRVVSGPFRWKVPIEKIESVRPTRSLMSSPAMSLDRLDIRYGKHRRILVSPADKKGFLRAIGHADAIEKQLGS